MPGHLIAFLVVALAVMAFAGILVLKEHRCTLELRKNKQNREEEDHNRWLYNIGLQETSYYFNPSGIRILNSWMLWKLDVLGK